MLRCEAQVEYGDDDDDDDDNVAHVFTSLAQKNITTAKVERRYGNPNVLHQISPEPFPGSVLHQMSGFTIETRMRKGKQSENENGDVENDDDDDVDDDEPPHDGPCRLGVATTT